MAALTWPTTLASVRPASRSASVSPTHKIGVIPAPNTARTFFATTWSDSPKCSRRSECPTITYSHFNGASIGGEISPVWAPLSCQWTSWAPNPYGSLSASSSVWSERNAVNGGQITTSTRCASSRSRR